MVHNDLRSPVLLAREIATPAVLRGSSDEMAGQLQRARDRYGFSYVTVWDGWAEDFAPVVERLAGR